MKQPTHFIEVYKEIYTSTLFNGVVLPLCDMDTELLITKVIKDLETIAVWKIYPKPQASVFVAHYDNDVKATIVQ